MENASNTMASETVYVFKEEYEAKQSKPNIPGKKNPLRLYKVSDGQGAAFWVWERTPLGATGRAATSHGWTAVPESEVVSLEKLKGQLGQLSEKDRKELRALLGK